MTKTNQSSSRLSAAVCALALSLLAFTGTAVNPNPAHASVAYVGVVA